MEEGKVLLMLVGVFAALALLSMGYIYVFSPLLSGPNLSPTDESSGIQFSPGEGCREVCDENNVFMGCERDFSDPVCGFSCRGMIDKGPMIGESPRVGATTCQFTRCVCN